MVDFEKLGFQARLKKPFKLETLQNVLQRVLS